MKRRGEEEGNRMKNEKNLQFDFFSQKQDGEKMYQKNGHKNILTKILNNLHLENFIIWLCKFRIVNLEK